MLAAVQAHAAAGNTTASAELGGTVAAIQRAVGRLSQLIPVEPRSRLQRRFPERHADVVRNEMTAVNGAGYF